MFWFSCPYGYVLISSIHRAQEDSTGNTIAEGPWTTNNREEALHFFHKRDHCFCLHHHTPSASSESDFFLGTMGLQTTNA
jgi:hypothetical protein